jgi:hypothetical protein
MSKVLRYESCPNCRDKGGDTRGDNLVRYRDGGAYCFACHTVTPAPMGNRFRVVEPDVPKSLCPIDFTREIPATAWKWLLQYGLPYTYWKDQVGYSPKEERLIFRVGKPLAFSIGRYFGGESGVRKWYAYGYPNRHCEVVGQGRGDTTFLVEDIVSAHIVAQESECIPLFGTSVSPKVNPSIIYYLINSEKKVKIWLDKDQQGMVKYKAARLSGLINRPVDIVVTDKDPKYYLKKLKEIL